ncbi:MAG: 5-(carboxyamino)imidazole ribonucleotide mutase [Planctomycetes bacterium]|nr:5-(carboxyamino)imidazole ribonucleotide mutase [Planctomycetota bacterium]
MTASPPSSSPGPLVGIVMGSRSDWATMQHASTVLDELAVPHECLVVSAHRTPDWLFEYANGAADRGLRAIVAGAGGAAHLPGMLASKTWLPVFGVPIEAGALRGLDALLSIAQMPGGVPVGTLAIGKAGATNAALLAAAVLATSDARIRSALVARRRRITDDVLAARDPRVEPN